MTRPIRGIFYPRKCSSKNIRCLFFAALRPKVKVLRGSDPVMAVMASAEFILLEDRFKGQSPRLVSGTPVCGSGDRMPRENSVSLTGSTSLHGHAYSRCRGMPGWRGVRGSLIVKTDKLAMLARKQGPATALGKIPLTFGLILVRSCFSFAYPSRGY